MTSTKKSEGYVYVLVSPTCEYIKIGGTDFAPLHRIKQINSCKPYEELGPWTLHDFRQVADWHHVEYVLHYTFRSKLVRSIPGQRELFALSPVEASRCLEGIDESLILKKPKIDRMFQDQQFSNFLIRLFQFTAITNWLDLQGAWTFSLFPNTNGGRYYTINIGPHEVAFATIAKNNYPSVHMIHMDSLVKDFEEVRSWVKKRNGTMEDNNYKSGLERSTSIFFEGDFEVALEFLDLSGVRRAIIAYWTEALIKLQEKQKSSVFSRYHNWNAVAELKKSLLGKWDIAGSLRKSAKPIVRKNKRSVVYSR